jgi:hypothetical protein
MKKTIINLEQLPKWYGIGIALLYSVLLAEFFSTLNHITPISIDDALGDLFSIVTKISYAVTILSGIIIWIISTFLFHLTALLFNGHSSFKRFLFVSSYPYLIPAIMILASIFILDGVQISDAEEAMTVLINNQSFKLAMNLINYSFIPYYLMIAVLIHYIYQIKYLYALFSVVIPIASIWGITELFKLI